MFDQAAPYGITPGGAGRAELGAEALATVERDPLAAADADAEDRRDLVAEVVFGGDLDLHVAVEARRRDADELALAGIEAQPVGQRRAVDALGG